jgi:ribosomal protein S18 acetylase RimI-like enzyme
MPQDEAADAWADAYGADGGQRGNTLFIKRAAAACYPDLYVIFRRAGPDQPEAAERGFLLSRYDLAEFAAFLDRCVVFCACFERMPAGFVVVEPAQFDQLTEFDLRLGDDERASLVRASLQWIRMLAVAPQYGRRGIGSALYRYLFARYPGAHLLTGLYEAPLDNRASRAFHKGLGFQRIGESRHIHTDPPHARVSGIYLRKPARPGI